MDYPFMKVYFLGILLAAYIAFADEQSDRKSIERVLAALNTVPLRSGLFTVDADGITVLLKPLDVKRGATPTVTISKEPWGEATIQWPDSLSAGRAEIPRIAGRAIRFITPDAALADAVRTFGNGTQTKSKPLLFVLKRVGSEWKIATIRELAEDNLDSHPTTIP